MADSVIRKKLILIGNGLDIAIGLKTRYSDFILYYFKAKIYELAEMEPNEEDMNFCVRDKFYAVNITKDKLPIIGLFKLQLTEALKKISDCKSVVEIFATLRKEGFFWECSPFLWELLNTAQWCDVERTYYTELLRLYNQLGKGKMPREPKNEFTIEGLNQELDELKKYVEIYLIEEQQRTQKLLDEMDHLQVFVRQTIASPYDKSDSSLWVNFNYTNAMTKALEKTFGEGRIPVLHIHGELGNEANPIIFGYGDDTDEHFSSLESANVDEYLRHFKAYRYSQNENYEKLLGFIENSEYFEVALIGHSCGLSDRTMLKTIFEHERCKSIEIYHYNEGEKEAKEEFFYKDISIGRHFNDKVKKRSRVKSFDQFYKIPQNKKSNKEN